MTESSIETPRGRPAPKTSDVVGTGLLAMLGLVAVLMGLGYGFFRDDGLIGPGFMPVLTGGFILVAAVAEIGRLYLAPKGQSTAGLGGVAEELSAEAAAAQRAARTDPEAEGEGPGGEQRDTFGRTAAQRRRTVPLIFVILLAAMVLTQLIGMLLSMALMMFAIINFVEKKPPVPSLLTSAVVLLMAYLIFVQMLGVPLPQGLLGIL
ncbi:tripartite tricarboxylate transporter TctB family protein [Brachybacterium vulturis]|uniref:tripartite tricarboxylate transporter TctB family protein n=1 Tax=Brachybacterium vulturis TaxID=2017484 RepID=UPI003736C739